MGIEPLAHRQISQLSGGQQQRAFIARALIQEADLYFMDEPFIGIDSASMQVISSLLRQLQQQGKTIFVVHHDLESIPSSFDWVLMLNMRLVANGPVSEVFNPELIQKTFGKDLNLFEQAIQLKQAKQTGKL